MAETLSMVCSGTHSHAAQAENEVEIMTKGMSIKLATVIMKKSEAGYQLMEKA